ncbi:glutamyl-tRNA(Gln) amidotransferase subunit A, mitochondrial [Galendromus occidentalis]|uniref:Glutamyl-tRNA(Gln) amidotransferase subunit A, mitochondrial n=1 Tax=Galendromus occidentalis TaxID=34638 RepID=A0AAJ6QV36_9ACAR|nr:glutamyl-tRNA(Gln) amidotransferase subunit A, mitochondrial [Galendromus occidentalis]
MLVDGIGSVARGLAARTLLPSEICAASLQRIKQTEELNAYITVVEEKARLRARQGDKRCESGKILPLDGVTIAVKDNFCTAGVRTTCASKMLEDFVPRYTATVIQRLERSGAIVIGKTNMDEFAMGAGATDSRFGPSKNPWRYERAGESIAGDFYITGGSSGGSAVAVASGTCFGAVGSDTGGSVRNPSARCGVFALKPSYGALSRHGLIPLTHSLDVPGLIGLTIDDLALMFSICAGVDPLDSTTIRTNFSGLKLHDEPALNGLRVGIPQEYHCPGMQDEVIKLWTDVADLLEKLGCEVVAVSLPHTQYSLQCYSVLNCCDVASNLACYDGLEFGCRTESMESTEDLFAETRLKGFSDVVRGRILSGNFFLLKGNYDKFFRQAMRLRRLIYSDFETVFRNVDLLLAPVTLTEAILYSEWSKKDNRTRATLEDYCTQPANLAGLPALSLPCRLSRNGLPLGLQLIGPALSEARLMNTGKRIELEMDFQHSCK